MKSRLLLVASVAALLTACATPASEPPAQVAGPASDPGPLPEMGGFGVDLAGMDPAVKPGDSFFRHVNGRWLETTEIPADRASYNSFTRLTIKAAAQTREIIEDVARNPSTDDERKIAAYF